MKEPNHHSINFTISKLQNLTILLATISLFVASIPIPASIAGINITLVDPLIGITFLFVIVTLYKEKTKQTFPVPILLFVVAFIITNIISRTQISGVIESAQRIEQFICGITVFVYLLQEKSKWAERAVLAGLCLNALIGIEQYFSASVPHGTFQNPVVFSFYLAIVSLWLYRQIASKPNTLTANAITFVTLLIISLLINHGIILALFLIIALVLTIIQHPKNSVPVILAIVLVSTIVLAFHTPYSKRIKSTLTIHKQNGNLKQCHVEIIAASRMTKENFWHGVGSGNYQQCIGTYYRELPNPNQNEIAPGTQSGYGILASCCGVPTLLLFLFILLLAIQITTQKITTQKSEATTNLACLIFITLATLLSDPFVRGLAWFLILPLATSITFRKNSKLYPKLNYLSNLAIIIACTLLVVTLFLIPKREKKGNTPPPPPSKTNNSNSPIIGTEEEIFILLNSKNAQNITPPMIIEQAKKASQNTVLAIPDFAGKPPADKQPNIKYGGAEFQCQNPNKPQECRIWFRVWWAGSCGNTIYLKINEQKKNITVGNDGTYKAWHWIPAPLTIILKNGKNNFQILNREDGIKLDQILITNDFEYIPQGIEEL